MRVCTARSRRYDLGAKNDLPAELETLLLVIRDKYGYLLCGKLMAADNFVRAAIAPPQRRRPFRGCRSPFARALAGRWPACDTLRAKSVFVTTRRRKNRLDLFRGLRATNSVRLSGRSIQSVVSIAKSWHFLVYSPAEFITRESDYHAHFYDILVQAIGFLGLLFFFISFQVKTNKRFRHTDARLPDVQSAVRAARRVRNCAEFARERSRATPCSRQYNERNLVR